MITGPSKFPTRRNEKRNAAADRRLEELLDFRARALAAIKHALTPELRPIMSGDRDALQRLTDKIRRAEAKQERMKVANAAIRRHAKAGTEAQVAALLALGFSEQTARMVLKADELGRIGFADYQLKNNNANIRRMRGRLESVSVAKAAPATESTAENGIRIEDSPAENRVRLFFPGKPSAEVRARLKENGFRWTPSLLCWQAYGNTGSVAHAQEYATKDGGLAEDCDRRNG